MVNTAVLFYFFFVIILCLNLCNQLMEIKDFISVLPKCVVYVDTMFIPKDLISINDETLNV